ncbi:hypothetical protein J3F83DRAFT_322139 [Trichoderma novae-zelandiae]
MLHPCASAPAPRASTMRDESSSSDSQLLKHKRHTCRGAVCLWSALREFSLLFHSILVNSPNLLRLSSNSSGSSTCTRLRLGAPAVYLFEPSKQSLRLLDGIVLDSAACCRAQPGCADFGAEVVQQPQRDAAYAREEAGRYRSSLSLYIRNSGRPIATTLHRVGKGPLVNLPIIGSLVLLSSISGPCPPLPPVSFIYLLGSLQL